MRSSWEWVLWKSGSGEPHSVHTRQTFMSIIINKLTVLNAEDKTMRQECYPTWAIVWSEKKNVRQYVDVAIARPYSRNMITVGKKPLPMN